MKARVISAKRLRKFLSDLGFEEETGRDHIFYFYRFAGKIVVHTKLSHGAKDIRQPVLGLVGKQLYLNRSEFEIFLSGNLDRNQYEAMLLAKGITE